MEFIISLGSDGFGDMMSCLRNRKEIYNYEIKDIFKGSLENIVFHNITFQMHGRLISFFLMHTLSLIKHRVIK